MVLPEALIDAIRQRASDQGVTITSYVSALVRADLGQSMPMDLPQISLQLQELRRRVEQLERLCQSPA
jgi:hypothetical protein